MLALPSIALGAAKLFKPTDLGTGLQVLFEPAGIAFSGPNVTGWSDSSPNHSDLSVANSAPTYVSDNGHGLPAAAFNGTNQFLSNAVSIRCRSFFAVISDLSAAVSVACLCGAGRIYANLGVNNQLAVFTNAFAPVSGQTIDTARHSVAVVQRAANDVDFYLDGVKATVTTGNTFYSDTPVSMGAENGSIQYTVVHVEHMSIFDTALSDANVAQMLGYLRRVYGV